MQIFEIFFYLTIVLLPTQLGYHFWPDWTLVLGRRVDYLAPTLFLTDITIILTLVTWFVQKNTRSTIAKTIRAHKILLCVGISLIVGNIFFSSNPTITLYKWGKVFEFLLFFYYIYTSKPSLKKIAYCFAAAILYSSIIAIPQLIRQQTIGGFFWFLGERTFTIDTPGIAKINWCWFSPRDCKELLRPYATFPHPNILGGFLATSIPILIFTLQKEKNKLIRIFLMTSMILGVCTLGISFSRSAWMIGSATIFGILLLTTKKVWTTRIIGSICIVTFLLFAWPYIGALNTGNESVFIRLDLASAALRLFTLRPLTGVGLGTFLPNLPNVIQIRDLYFLQPVHNIYLLFLSETGIFGLIVAGIAAYLYKKSLHISKQMYVLILPCIAIGLLGCIDHYSFTVQQGQLLTACLFALPFLKTNS